MKPFQVLSRAGAAALTLCAAAAGAQTVMTGAEQSAAVSGPHLPSLRGQMINVESVATEHRVVELRHLPLIDGPGTAADPVVQKNAGTAAPTTAGLGFDGLGKGFPNFTVHYAPPDTTGAVGATQYVQWVNAQFAVFDKATGNLVYGPADPNTTIWNKFGGPCETNNDGDPIVQYDKLANRWVMSQFAVPGGTAGYWQCVAVSQTSDATGAWYRYAFPYTNFPDYPKVGVWPDAYYTTFNMFNGNSFAGARVCAYDRANMLAGATTVTQQCFQLSTSYGSLLPADLDGTTLPPAGSPNYLVNRLSTALGFWKFHVDWANPGNTTLTQLTSITVPAYNAACGGGTCIPQAGTSQKLDSLADRLMYRLAYRNINGVERMVVNHAVMVNNTNKPNSGNSAIRWYEIRFNAGAPYLYQKSSWSPDTRFRWMGSAAMDKQGNMAIGYSVSSSGQKPSLMIASRLAGDPLNTLGNETQIVAGTGAQLPNLSRWGDYTHMSIDPVDDCTFWYTGQYLKADGTFNWSTRIASFKINGCQ